MILMSHIFYFNLFVLFLYILYIMYNYVNDSDLRYHGDGVIVLLKCLEK